ncbi:hypothetical protein F0562_027074 [Nyssa sinensis]|uniref:non-specific serine/threonine protein kinase n=1 Tax=Nyssa sinensis TaxID=561372 RepID=A0A5J5B5D5_9ASTE|nr:hypothetical protein F0562_027074 [Nyssa sinensis]
MQAFFLFFAMEDTESCSSRPLDLLPTQSRQRRHKVEVYHEVLRRLKETNNEEASQPGFDDELWAHFNRLPVRYALDVNVERAEDVLMHRKLLHMALDPASRPAFEFRPVQVHHVSNGNSGHSVHSNFTKEVDSGNSSYPGVRSIHPPPAFGLSSNLEVSLETNKSHVQVGDSAVSANLHFFRPLHEITISTIDKPKLLSQLTSLLSEIGLNIQEAHAFSTTDGYSLDVFVVDGWDYEETDRLRNILVKEIPKIEKLSHSTHLFISPTRELGKTESKLIPNPVSIPTDGVDVWEIDAELLKFEHKIAAGSYGDLYRGTFHSQDVAIKVFKAEYLNEDVWREFAQEVYILRKVRHKNVVQFIGACTRPPNLCIVTEFMSGGSVYDFLHKQKGIFKLPDLLRVAMDVSKGMSYLHQNNIVHRDLKAANLLMDEYEVVKVADFGVARVQDQSGVMTAETGTYRWMAPEVIDHKPYDHKVDVFSFGIVLWELLTGKIPYENLSPLQAAVGVVQKGLRPTIPRDTHPEIGELLERCWQQDPCLRPEFSKIIEILQHIVRKVAEEKRTGKRTYRIALEQTSNGQLKFSHYIPSRTALGALWVAVARYRPNWRSCLMDKLRKSFKSHSEQNLRNHPEERLVLLHQNDGSMVQSVDSADRREVLIKINGRESPRETELASHSQATGGGDDKSVNNIWRDSSYDFSNDAMKVAKEFDFVTDSPLSQCSQGLSRIPESPSYGQVSPKEVRVSFNEATTEQVRRRSNVSGGRCGGEDEVVLCSSNSSFQRKSSLLQTKTKSRLMDPPELDQRSQRLLKSAMLGKGGEIDED